MITFLLWLLLAVVAWPLAVIALLLWPIVWLLGIPLRLIGISVRGVLEVVEAIVRLPARIVGAGGAARAG
jgi:hypothetical protein